jgi:hypothetical protein
MIRVSSRPRGPSARLGLGRCTGFSADVGERELEVWKQSVRQGDRR